MINDPYDIFESLVGWCEDLIELHDAPGFIVGLSGTDSILAFMICAKALERRGAGHRMIGVHYGEAYPPTHLTEEQTALLLSKSPSYRWVSRLIIPWLAKEAPQAKLLVEPGPKDDYERWADLFTRSLAGADKRSALEPGTNYWVVGTRNATEQALGTYSNMSSAVSVQPLIRLWKSDVLDLCSYLDVPKIAIQQSRQVDCDCGRYDLAADHIEEVDAILQERAGEKTRVSIDPELRLKLNDFVDEQIAYAAFKRHIPYMPPVREALKERSL